jgi:uncharacterized protein YgbK (DUF1537 family)
MMLAILADDLTGACDAGACFTRGAAVPVTVFPQRRPRAEVTVVDAESRALSPSDARARVRAVVSEMPPPDHWFKKIDSTLRGAVAVEVGELLAQKPGAGAVLCPAFPAQGRTVRNRVLRIDGTPIRETALSRDPDFALASSDIVDALRPTTTRPLEWCGLESLRSGRLTPRAGVILVCDAEVDSDLDTIVETALVVTPPPVLVGSAGLAAALARRLGRDGASPGLPAGARWLIMSGSRHPVTAAQIDAIRDRPVRIITPSRAPSSDRLAVAAELARQARKIIETEAVDLVAVTGGDTAVALYRELDAERIELLGAPVPGLALGRLHRGDGRALLVLTKAGGFGAPDLFATLMT